MPNPDFFPDVKRLLDAATKYEPGDVLSQLALVNATLAFQKADRFRNEHGIVGYIRTSNPKARKKVSR